MRLLVVDFDYFVPLVERPEDGKDWMMYDWGHSEAWSASLLNHLWTTRAADFIRQGFDLPTTSGEEVNFWSRFLIEPNAPFYIADSNVRAYDKKVLKNVNEVWLYDAHHDSGYRAKNVGEVLKAGKVSCEDWMIGYWWADADLHVRYPKWRHYAMDLEPEPIIKIDRQVDDGEDVDLMFDKIFVCRSGAWVPSWLDKKFFEFVLRCHSVLLPEKLDEIKKRDWDWGAARKMAEEVATVMEDLRGRKDGKVQQR